MRDELGSVPRGGLTAQGAAAGAAARPARGDLGGATDVQRHRVYISKTPSPSEWDPARPTPYDVDAT